MIDMRKYNTATQLKEDILSNCFSCTMSFSNIARLFKCKPEDVFLEYVEYKRRLIKRHKLSKVDVLYNTDITSHNKTGKLLSDLLKVDVIYR